MAATKTAVVVTPGSSVEAVSVTNPLEALLIQARQAGVAREQIGRFIQAGYIPQPKQLQYHAACRTADEPDGPVRIALGGARGPGKSHASFAQGALDDCQRFAGLKVLYLRKVGKSAKESFSDLRAKILTAVPHHYKEYTGLLTFPNGSLILTGNYNKESDIDKYLGIEYDLIVIEEATQLSEQKILMLEGSLRTSKPGWRPRMYLTTNPGGIGHQWFKRLFVLPYRAKRERDTRFIPANWRDNKFLNPEYVTYLKKLRGVLGRMWRDGDWDVGAGQYFIHWDYDRHVIRPIRIPEHWPMWVSIDYGWNHPTAVHWHTRHDGLLYTLAEHVQSRWLPAQHSEVIRRVTAVFNRRIDQLERIVGGHDMFSQRGDSEARTVAQQYAELGIVIDPANIDRLAGAAEMLKRLGSAEAGLPPTWYVFDTCTELIECIPAMQVDPKRPEDVLKVDANEEGEGGDDPYDSARYGLMAGQPASAAGVSYRF